MKKYPHEDYIVVWNNVKQKFFHKKVWYRGLTKRRIMMTDINLGSIKIHAQFFTSGNFDNIKEAWEIQISDTTGQLLAKHEIPDTNIDNVEREAMKFYNEFCDYE